MNRSGSGVTSEITPVVAHQREANAGAAAAPSNAPTLTPARPRDLIATTLRRRAASSTTASSRLGPVKAGVVLPSCLRSRFGGGTGSKSGGLRRQRPMPGEPLARKGGAEDEAHGRAEGACGDRPGEVETGNGGLEVG